MPVLVDIDEKRGLTSIRHSWRMEIFSDYGDDPLIRAHRALVVYDTETEEAISITHDTTIERRFSELPEGPRNTLLAAATLADFWEAEDSQRAPKDVS